MKKLFAQAVIFGAFFASSAFAHNVQLNQALLLFRLQKTGNWQWQVERLAIKIGIHHLWQVKSVLFIILPVEVR